MYVCCISIRSCICDLQAAILEFPTVLWHADILHALYVRVYIELFILFYILLLLEHVWKAICQMLFILKYLWNSDVLDTVFILVCLCVCGKVWCIRGCVYCSVCMKHWYNRLFMLEYVCEMSYIRCCVYWSVKLHCIIHYL